MEAICRCHSCGTEVDASTRRCPNCYVALGEASRAPSPLRAAPSAAPVAGQLALKQAQASAPVIAAIAAERQMPEVVRCPACETSVLPVTGWCSYCMEPLPFEDPSSDASTLAAWDFEDFEPAADETAGAKVIAGPWADRPVVGITYARWQQRAFAALIDASAFVPAALAFAFSTAIGSVLLVAAVAFTAWQICGLQGRTGQTIGKNRLGIFLVQESNLAPIGARRSALRQLAHGIDAALVGVGFLWPLWDAKHQTFADQLFATVVVAG